MAVNDAVIDRKRDIGHRTDEDRVLAIHVADDDSLLELADAEDRRLPLMKYDRSREQRA